MSRDVKDAWWLFSLTNAPSYLESIALRRRVTSHSSSQWRRCDVRWDVSCFDWQVADVAFSQCGSRFVTVGVRHVKFWSLESTKSRVGSLQSNLKQQFFTPWYMKLVSSCRSTRQCRCRVAQGCWVTTRTTRFVACVVGRARWRGARSSSLAVVSSSSSTRSDTWTNGSNSE